MRSRLEKETVACFTQEFEREFREFKRFKPDSDTPIWAWRLVPNLTFFVRLQPFDDEDQFVVEIAWSDNGEFPWGKLTQLSHIENPRGHNRLARLWAIGSEAPAWDLAPETTAAVEANLEALRRGESRNYPADPPIEQILPRIKPLVDDALQKLGQFGIPLFRRVAEHRGLQWPEQDAAVGHGSNDGSH